jgi:hypothetical protein
MISPIAHLRFLGTAANRPGVPYQTMLHSTFGVIATALELPFGNAADADDHSSNCCG